MTLRTWQEQKAFEKTLPQRHRHIIRRDWLGAIVERHNSIASAAKSAGMGSGSMSKMLSIYEVDVPFPVVNPSSKPQPPKRPKLPESKKDWTPLHYMMADAMRCNKRMRKPV